MQTTDSIRILTIETSANVAEVYNSALLSSGHAIRTTTLSDVEEMSKLLKENQFDLILFNINNPYLSIKQLQSEVDGHPSHIGIILIAAGREEMTPEMAILHGARDLVYANNIDHLVAVVLREYQHSRLVRSNVEFNHKMDELNNRCNVLMDSSRDPIAYIHEGMHIYANKTYLEKFGFTEFSELEGESIMDFTAKEEQENFKKLLREISQNPEDVKKMQSKFILKDGEVLDGEVEFSPASIDGETCTQMIIREAVSALNNEELEAQLEQVSQLDPVSGLLNRVVFLGQVTEQILCIENEQFALLQIGIHGFDKIEEKLGLVSCDQVIGEMGKLIKDNLPASSIAGRRDSHIYLVMIPFKEEKSINILAQSIINKTEKHIVQTSAHSINIECSIGISIIDDKNLEIDEIIARTSKAYQAAIEKGPSTIEIYKPSEGEMSQKQIDNNWVREIKTALTKNQFQLLFQPMIKLNNDGNEHYEVFMQMVDDKGERIPTGNYLPSAERTGISKLIDRWVITSAFKTLSTRAKTKPNTIFFIKLTGGSLADRELFRWISTKIKELKISPNSVVFEVKEEAVITHLKQAQAFADLLKTIKCQFAIDDFGKGPDPFKLVDLIPANYLKFASGFAKDLANNQENQATLREINEKAKGLNKQTVIKHVEDAATLSVLWSIGTDFTQGNFFQTPSEKMEYDFSA